MSPIISLPTLNPAWPGSQPYLPNHKPDSICRSGFFLVVSSVILVLIE
jgi:hypothetical protein